MTERLDSRSNKHIANSSGPMTAADSLDDGAVCFADLWLQLSVSTQVQTLTINTSLAGQE